MNVKIEDSNGIETAKWDKVQLLIDEELGHIVITTCDPVDALSFSGTDLKTLTYSQYWMKERFKPFNGTVTLSND